MASTGTKTTTRTATLTRSETAATVMLMLRRVALDGISTDGVSDDGFLDEEEDMLMNDGPRRRWWHLFWRRQEIADAPRATRSTRPSQAAHEAQRTREILTHAIKEGWLKRYRLITYEIDLNTGEKIAFDILDMELDAQRAKLIDGTAPPRPDEVVAGSLERMAEMFNEASRVAQMYQRDRRVEEHFSYADDVRHRRDELNGILGLMNSTPIHITGNRQTMTVSPKGFSEFNAQISTRS